MTAALGNRGRAVVRFVDAAGRPCHVVGPEPEAARITKRGTAPTTTRPATIRLGPEYILAADAEAGPKAPFNCLEAVLDRQTALALAKILVDFAETGEIPVTAVDTIRARGLAKPKAKPKPRDPSAPPRPRGRPRKEAP